MTHIVTRAEHPSASRTMKRSVPKNPRSRFSRQVRSNRTLPRGSPLASASARSSRERMGSLAVKRSYDRPGSLLFHAPSIYVPRRYCLPMCARVLVCDVQAYGLKERKPLTAAARQTFYRDRRAATRAVRLGFSFLLPLPPPPSHSFVCVESSRTEMMVILREAPKEGVAGLRVTDRAEECG